MNVIKHAFSWLWKKWLMMDHSSTSTPKTTVVNSPVTGPNPTGTHTSNFDHVERRHTLFRQAGPNDVITEREEKHSQFDDAQESDITKTQIITCSGTIIKPSQAKGVCSSCGFLDKELERCSECGCLLCPICKQEFDSETGEKKPVCKTHYRELSEKFNTWKYFTARQNGGNP